MYDIYDLFAPPPEPLIPRPFRLEIDERIDATGQVITSPSADSIEEVIETVRRSGIQSVAISFLHSYLNPEHERNVAEALREALPGISVSLSSSVAPIAGEYERTSTVVADAFTKPKVHEYVTQLSHSLSEAGVREPLHLMLSSGEIASVSTAIDRPIRLLESGPAAGAIAAAYFGRPAVARHGRDNS
jgi:N-methylhydantoinase A